MVEKYPNQCFYIKLERNGKGRETKTHLKRSHPNRAIRLYMIFPLIFLFECANTIV